MRFLDVWQADRLIERAGEHGLEAEVLLRLGMRFGETAGLKVSDLDVRRKRIRIQRSIDRDGNESTTKTKTVREAPVPDSLLSKLVEETKNKNIATIFLFSHLGKPWTGHSWRSLTRSPGMPWQVRASGG